MPVSKELRIAVLRAYADCCGGVTTEGEPILNDFHPEADRMSMRNLNFITVEMVTRDEAADLMEEACPEGYNDFQADVIRKLPAEARVKIAREHSVCLYVSGASLKACRILDADECHVVVGGIQGKGVKLIRLWWD